MSSFAQLDDLDLRRRNFRFYPATVAQERRMV